MPDRIKILIQNLYCGKSSWLRIYRSIGFSNIGFPYSKGASSFRRTVVCRLDRNDASFLVESQSVGTYLTMDARSLVGVEVVLVDAMIEDVPLVLAWNLEYGVVGGAIDSVLRVLLQNYRLVGNLDRA